MRAPLALRLAPLLLVGAVSFTGATNAAGQELGPAQERRLGERHRSLAQHHELSGLGMRGPERLSVEAQQLDPAAERALALALHAGAPLSHATRRSPIAQAGAGLGRDALPARAFTPPSIGYGLIAVLALGGLFWGARRHRTRVIVASAFDRLSAPENARALR